MTDDRPLEVPPPGPRVGLLRAVVSGICMGTADAIPGVSGGTIALILGIYERFVGALDDVVAVGRHPRDAEVRFRAFVALKFLVPLAVGLAGAYYAATRLLVGKIPIALPGESAAAHAERLLSTPPPGWLVRPNSAPIVFAFFFGVVLLSISAPWREKRGHKGVDWVIALIGAVVAASLSLAPPAAGSLSPFALVGAGAVAISVMLLPGVSGSLALLVLGMYQPVSGALHDQEWGVFGWFLLGIAIGIGSFVPCLKWLLRRAHDRTMSFLSGLMLGSLAALWPWKAHYLPKLIPELGPMEPIGPFGASAWPIVSATAGAALIVVLTRVSARPTE